MVKNVVSFILLFVILIEKCGFLGSPMGCARWDRVIWCSPLSTSCLMEDEYSGETLD